MGNLRRSRITGVSNPTWETMLVGGGGFITGMDSQGGVLLARSDTPNSLYRWSAAANKWIGLLTSYSLPSGYVMSYGPTTASAGPANGVWEARIAPSNTSKFYMIYCNSPFVSTDSGASWTNIRGSGWPTDAFEANSSERNLNYRMMVISNNDNKVFVGTPTQGTYKTIDGGANWSKDTNLATPTSVGTYFAEDVASAGQTLYAAVHGTGVYRSVNGGTSWSRLNTTGEPTSFSSGMHMIVDQNGKLWLTNGSNLKTWANGVGWVNTAMTDGPAAVYVDPNNANNVLSVSYGGRFYKSTDGGTTFPQSRIPDMHIDGTGDALWMDWDCIGGYQEGGSGYSPGSYGLSTACLLSDNAGNVYYPNGFGVLKQTNANIFDGNSDVTNWLSFSRGMESIDANYLIHPPGGNPVGTCWDVILWNFTDSRTYAASYGPDDNFYGPMPNYGVQNRGWNLDYASSNPDYLVLCWSQGGYYSTNKGVNWQPFTNTSGSPWARAWLGACAAASTPNNIVVMVEGTQPAYTTDGGVNWSSCTYAGNDNQNFPSLGCASFVCADRVIANRFYIRSPGDGWYLSTNSGATFSKVSSDTRGDAFTRVKCVPGNAGHVFWVTGQSLNLQPEANALLRISVDSASTFNTLSDFIAVEDVGFGTIVSGQTYPTIYLAAYRSSASKYGIWECVDFNPTTRAGTWTLLSNSDGTNYPEGHFAAITGVAGDPDVDHRVSVCYTNGGFKRYRS